MLDRRGRRQEQRQTNTGRRGLAAAMLVGFIDDNRPGSVDLVILR